MRTAWVTLAHRLLSSVVAFADPHAAAPSLRRMLTLVVSTVNLQVAIHLCFAPRNTQVGLRTAGQMPYGTVNLGRNNYGAGVDRAEFIMGS